MVVNISLPKQFRAPNLFRALKVRLFDPSELPENVEFDFTDLRFVRPSGVVLLNNVVIYLQQRGCEVNLVGTDPSKDSIKFLDDSGFFLKHTGELLSADSKPRKTTLPLMDVDKSAALLWVENQLIPWLSNSADIPVRDLAELGTCMKELFNNISDHTSANVGSIFAQWFPIERQIMICLGDLGPGIPETARRVVSGMSDALAIKRSFEDGFTAKSIPTNRGVGLHYLKQNVVLNLNGIIEVHSGTGEVKIEKDGSEPKFMLMDSRGYCPGTLLNIMFKSDQIERSPPEPEVFEW
jgi:anti-sigma regulatory factor (Ser/Thr protein kinase)